MKPYLVTLNLDTVALAADPTDALEVAKSCGMRAFQTPPNLSDAFKVVGQIVSFRGAPKNWNELSIPYQTDSSTKLSFLCDLLPPRGSEQEAAAGPGIVPLSCRAEPKEAPTLASLIQMQREVSAACMQYWTQTLEPLVRQCATPEEHAALQEKMAQEIEAEVAGSRMPDELQSRLLVFGALHLGETGAAPSDEDACAPGTGESTTPRQR